MNIRKTTRLPSKHYSIWRNKVTRQEITFNLTLRQHDRKIEGDLQIPIPGTENLPAGEWECLVVVRGALQLDTPEKDPQPGDVIDTPQFVIVQLGSGFTEWFDKADGYTWDDLTQSLSPEPPHGGSFTLN